jgi:hypothetical protein
MAVSFVKAAQEFFSAPPFGKKVEIAEFKALTTKDKVELSEMLNAEKGYEHEPYTPPTAA